MTYEQFWDGDCTLVRYYREAQKIRDQRTNQQLWLQGMYVYEAICDASPILHDFAKKGTKAHPYPSEPYALGAEQKESREEKKQEQIQKKGFAMMEQWMAAHNEKMKHKQPQEAKEVKSDGRDG